MLVRFKKVDGAFGQNTYIETDRVIGIEFGHFYMGRATSMIKLDSNTEIEVFGDPEDTAIQINIAKEPKV